MSERTQHWQNVHTTKPVDDVSWWQSPDSLWLDLMTSRAEPTASVIDVGSGSGMLADELLAAGFTDVTLCDISPAALQRTEERLGDRVSYLVGDITDLHSGRRFDVWFDRAVFHFLTDGHDVDEYRASLLRNTEPGAFVIIATFAEDGPEQCSGLDVHRYTTAELAAAFAPECTVIHQERRVHTTPWGTDQPFSVVTMIRA